MDAARFGSFPSKDNDGINSDLRLIPCIEGAEMRRIMLVEIHTNHDAKETADFWHRPYANTPFHIPIRPDSNSARRLMG